MAARRKPARAGPTPGRSPCRSTTAATWCRPVGWNGWPARIWPPRTWRWSIPPTVGPRRTRSRRCRRRTRPIFGRPASATRPSNGGSGIRFPASPRPTPSRSASGPPPTPLFRSTSTTAVPRTTSTVRDSATTPTRASRRTRPSAACKPFWTPMISRAATSSTSIPAITPPTSRRWPRRSIPARRAARCASSAAPTARN